jgi:cysteinyl-tRNA synthetase
MIAMIQKLIALDHAYVADHHVLFSVPSMAEYGRLSGRSRDEMIAGARVEVAPYKRDPADFVLWKPSSAEQPGWESPWGRGRPGWHIECSAMSEAHLGETFDIHGGGLDLIFPHHENEIAQSVSAHNGKPFVRYWMHNGFVIVEGEKMSKSLGNFRTIRDVLGEAPGEAARYAMLMSHYRDPLDWTGGRLAEAKHALDRFYLALRQGPPPAPAAPPAPVLAALEDDLNTPLALAALHDTLSALNKAGAGEEKRRLMGDLRAGGALLGLLQQDAEAWLKGDAQVIADATVVNPRIDELVRQRTEARRSKNFALADSIRAQLAMEGVVLEDKPDGTTEWRRT